MNCMAVKNFTTMIVTTRRNDNNYMQDNYTGSRAIQFDLESSSSHIIRYLAPGRSSFDDV